MKRPTFTVSDGKLVLSLEAAEEEGYIVTSPLDPELVTQAESLEEALEMARDAAQALRQSRANLRAGSARDQPHWLAADFDGPLDDFREYTE